MFRRLFAVILIIVMIFSLNIIQASGEVPYSDDLEPEYEYEEEIMDIGDIIFSYTKADSSVKKIKLEVNGGFSADITSFDLTLPAAYSSDRDNLSVKLDLSDSSEDIKVFAEYPDNEGRTSKIPMTDGYRAVRGLFKGRMNPENFQLAIYDASGNPVKTYTVNLIYGDDYGLEKTAGFSKVKSYLTKNPCYTEGTKIKVKGLMLHSVGEPRPTADYYIRKWNKKTYKRACVHGFINATDGTLYQTLPWNRRGWHAGGAANNTHIGIEMCEPANIRYTTARTVVSEDILSSRRDARRTYFSAVELFAELCDRYNLDPLEDGVIISHSEGYKLRTASNHADPEHLWKGLGLDFTMDGFRQDVANRLNEMTGNIG